MASEVRVNKIQSQSGLGTMTLTDGGPEFTGITTITTGNVDGNCLYLKNEEVGLYFGNWGTGSTYPRTSTINATRTDSSTPLPVLRVAGQGGLEFASDLNTVRMSIDSSGRVTMPYQPAFSARNVGGGTPLNGNIVLNTTIVNNGGHYSTSTGNFTAPVAGMYYFSFTGFTENNSSASADIAIHKNGTSVVRTYTNEASNVYRPFAVDCIISLAANDTVRPNSGIDLHGNLNPNFSGFLIG